MNRNIVKQQIIKIAARSNIKYKDESKIQKLIGKLLSPFNKNYMNGYATTMFGTIWLPSESWYINKLNYKPEHLYGLLLHEKKHLEDERKFSLFFWITYMLILPFGITMRAFWEWRAYKVSLSCHKKLFGAVPSFEREHIVRQFTSSKYLWMFPFKRFMRRKVDKFCQAMDIGDGL